MPSELEFPIKSEVATLLGQLQAIATSLSTDTRTFKAQPVNLTPILGTDVGFSLGLSTGEREECIGVFAIQNLNDGWKMVVIPQNRTGTTPAELDPLGAQFMSVFREWWQRLHVLGLIETGEIGEFAQSMAEKQWRRYKESIQP